MQVDELRHQNRSNEAAGLAYKLQEIALSYTWGTPIDRLCKCIAMMK